MTISPEKENLRKELITSQSENKLSNKAKDIIISIARKLSFKHLPKNEEDREYCLLFAIFDCSSYWKNYNPEKNAVSYITQIIKNGFGRGWVFKLNKIQKNKNK